MNLNQAPKFPVLFVPPHRFFDTPQCGFAVEMTWERLIEVLSEATTGCRKDVAEAWSAARYRHNIRRKDHLVRVYVLVLDIDEDGDIDRVAKAIEGYDAFIHLTFSSTPEEPRCRIVVRLAEPIDAPAYDLVHAAFRQKLLLAGIVADSNAVDASRLSYRPVARNPALFACRRIEGVPLDPVGVVAALPPGTLLRASVGTRRAVHPFRVPCDM